MPWQVELRFVPQGPEDHQRLGYWVFGIEGHSVELERPWGVVGEHPYRGLLRAVREIAAGAERSAVSWHLEPGEYRWAFTRDAAKVDVLISDFSGTFGQPLLQATCHLRELVRAVVSALDEWERNDDLAYLREWLLKLGTEAHERRRREGLV